jgi:Family of unknown function (DUF6445)
MIDRRIFAFNKDVRHRVEMIDGLPLLIAYDFFLNPADVVGLATSLDYNVDIRRGIFRQFPGERARISISQKPIIDWAQELLHPKFDGFTFCDCPAIFTKMNAEALREVDARQVVPHLDTDGILSLLIHLNHDVSETCFYRHNETGLSFLPPQPTQEIVRLMDARGFDPRVYGDYQAFKKHLMMNDTSDVSDFPMFTGLPTSTQNWELIHRVSSRWNRLICFVSNIFHSPVYKPRELPNSSRLTMNIFMQIT